MEMFHCRGLGTWLVFLALFLGTACFANAQAGVPEKGTGDVTVAYQNLFTTNHLQGDGSRNPIGTIRLIGLMHSVDYGVTDRLAVSLSLPYALGKYSGRSPHQLPIDNGTYHGSLQDLGIGIRYDLRTRPLILTPFFRLVLPSHRYEHFAHAAIGSQLREYQTGISFARRLESLPSAYFQGRYTLAVAQSVIGRRPVHSRFYGEFGYFLTRKLAVRALSIGQLSHGGLNFPQDYPIRNASDPRYLHHDRISKLHSINVGGGVSYEVSRRWSVFSSLVTTVYGTNGHALQTGLTVGMSWSFRTLFAAPPAGADARGMQLAAALRQKHAEIQVPQCSAH